MTPVQDPSLALSKPSGFIVGMRVMSVFESKSATLLTRGLAMAIICLFAWHAAGSKQGGTHWLVALHVAGVTHLVTTSFDILRDSASSFHCTIG